MISAVSTWYTDEIADRTESDLDNRLIPLGRRLAIGVVLGMSGLLVMDQLDVNISPLIAGLGLGGLAVALALQPTLANVFAGTYVMTEGVVTPGDYIELENGVAGYVMDVSWRSTRLRTWHNNLVVIPNAKFAETIITNYQEPQPAVNVFPALRRQLRQRPALGGANMPGSYGQVAGHRPGRGQGIRRMVRV